MPPGDSFDLVATATTAGSSNAKGAVTIPMFIRIDRYTPERELTAMTDALKFGGYPGFLKTLRESSKVGELEAAGQTFGVRWARQIATGSGRNVSIVTDQPVLFVGAGRRGAKPTAGFEVAVVQLSLDASGKGTGTMAAAARVKPGGESGVRLDNYADTPLKLTVTTRPRQ
jgi:hypothetical protein